MLTRRRGLAVGLTGNCRIMCTHATWRASGARRTNLPPPIMLSAPTCGTRTAQHWRHWTRVQHQHPYPRYAPSTVMAVDAGHKSEGPLPHLRMNCENTYARKRKQRTTHPARHSSVKVHNHDNVHKCRSPAMRCMLRRRQDVNSGASGGAVPARQTGCGSATQLGRGQAKTALPPP